jgi:hypothetical protein
VSKRPWDSDSQRGSDSSDGTNQTLDRSAPDASDGDSNNEHDETSERTVIQAPLNVMSSDACPAIRQRSSSR